MPTARQTRRPNHWRPDEHDHARADRPDDLHDHDDRAANFCRCRRGENVAAVEITNHSIDDQPDAARKEEPRQVAGRPSCRHQSGAGSRQQHEHRRAEVRDPSRGEQPDGDVGIRHRILVRGHHEMVADMVDRHDDDDQPAQHVDGAEPVGAMIRSGGRSRRHPPCSPILTLARGESESWDVPGGRRLSERNEATQVRAS